MNKKAQIRIIGKNPFLIRALSVVLSDAGYEVTQKAEQAVLTVVDMPLTLDEIGKSDKCVYLCNNGDSVPKGAEAVIIKPFAWQSLINCVNGICRGTDMSESGIRILGKCLVCGEMRVTLSTRELELFNLLKSRENTVVTREEMLDVVWKSKETKANVTDVYVNYLRTKIKRAFGIYPIKSVRNIGYMYSESDE